MCNEYNVDAIPEVVTQEKEKVLEVLQISKHPGYNPGTGEDFGQNQKGPFAGNDISVYHVDDTNFRLTEGELWPACLPKLEEPSSDLGSTLSRSESSEQLKDFFAGWMDPEPTYRIEGDERVATLRINYFQPRQTQVQKVKCADPDWMRSRTYYPPATVCYKDPSESSCFQNGNSGSSVMTHFKDKDNENAYAFTGPLSMHKGCDQVTSKKHITFCLVDFSIIFINSLTNNNIVMPSDIDGSRGVHIWVEKPWSVHQRALLHALDRGPV